MIGATKVGWKNLSTTSSGLATGFPSFTLWNILLFFSRKLVGWGEDWVGRVMVNDTLCACVALSTAVVGSSKRSKSIFSSMKVKSITSGCIQDYITTFWVMRGKSNDPWSVSLVRNAVFTKIIGPPGSQRWWSVEITFHHILHAITSTNTLLHKSVVNCAIIIIIKYTYLSNGIK